MATDTCPPSSKTGEAITMQLIVTLFFTCCMLFPASFSGAADTEKSFNLLYSNDVRGETEPCG